MPSTPKSYQNWSNTDGKIPYYTWQKVRRLTFLKD
jgi:hypothetical protein